MTPEGKVKARVKDALREAKAYQFWPVQTGMGAPTLDCLGCHRGRYFSVETKREGGKLTERQEWIVQQMQLAGAKVFIIDTTDENAQCWVELRAWLYLNY